MAEVVRQGQPGRRCSELLESERQRLAEEHFTYEVKMLAFAAARFKEFHEDRKIDGTPRHPESDERNMYLNAVLLHARALDEVLRPGGREDDVKAQCFVEDHLEKINVLDKSLWDEINKRLGHLTTARLHKPGTPYELIIRTVLLGVLDLIRQVPAKRRAWFDEAQGLATRTLALFPRQRGGGQDDLRVTTT